MPSVSAIGLKAQTDKAAPESERKFLSYGGGGQAKPEGWLPHNSESVILRYAVILREVAESSGASTLNERNPFQRSSNLFRGSLIRQKLCTLFDAHKTEAMPTTVG